MPRWFCRRHLALADDAAEGQLFAATADFLVRAALEQPVVFVHRDYPRAT
ncbi:MAG: hypothetical protein U1F06_09335 [Steroidobacteraceae bacterium]